MQLRTFLYFFLPLAGLELLAHLLPDLHALRYVTKPLLVPALLLLYTTNAALTDRTVYRLFVAGLLLGWLGDVLLLFEGPLFFMGGLGSFLLGHICYIAAFIRMGRQADPSTRGAFSTVLSAVALALYAFSFFQVVGPGLGEMKIPVLAYMVVILGMVVSVVHLRGRVPTAAYRWLLAGALLFVVSDSLLAWDRFYQPLPMAGFFIMATYIAAQFSLVRGMTEA